MRRLLSKTIMYSAGFSALLLILSAPLFYWMIQRMYDHQVNETLSHKKDYFVVSVLPRLTPGDIGNWNYFNPDQQIVAAHLPSVSSVPFYRDSILVDSSEMEPEPYRMLYAPIRIENGGYLLCLRQSLLEGEDVVKGIVVVYLGILVFLLAGLFLINRTISKKLWKPFYASLDYLREFNIKNPPERELPETAIKEFSELNTAIDRLVSKSLYAYRAQREFTENAAHELQTPIAIFLSHLDLLLQSSSLNKEQADTLQNLYETASRLSRLNKNLLALSKIDSHFYGEDEQIDLQKFILESWSNFSDHVASKNIEVKISGIGAVYQKANKDMLSMMVNNLFSNAIRHNYGNGWITITILPDQLLVSNTGISDALPAEKMFNRFSTFNSNTKGNGLGLTIIAAICKKYNWLVNYTYKNNLHVFSIHFENSSLKDQEM